MMKYMYELSVYKLWNQPFSGANVPFYFQSMVLSLHYAIDNKHMKLISCMKNE